jgi:DNA polymerase III alpha subunit
LAAWEVYSKAFDQFYIELQIIEFETQIEANRRLIEFAREVGAPLILACDSHYLDPSHAETHDLLMYIRQNKTRLDKVEKDEDVWDFEVRNLYYRTAAQMRRGFEVPFECGGKACGPFRDGTFTDEVFAEALANTMKVARQAEDIKLDGKVHLPKLYTDSREELRNKVNQGFKRLQLGQFPNKREYQTRLLHEFEVICKLGWADYFLVMERIVSMAKEEFASEVGEWAVGYGRGSAAGSLVSWCLGLTDCDPIEHGLLFERFLDEGRPDPPDIDTDFHPAIRDRVKDRIVEMFGREKTCSIGTYTSYKTRAVIIDVARALGLDVMEVNTVTKKMDPLKSFEDDDGDDVVVDKMEFEELRKHYPELDAYLEVNPEVLVHAEVIRNQVRNMGKHAGGVIISDMDLRDKIPVQHGADGGVVSSWAESGNSSELSQVGLVKYDILGLNNLPIISDCVAMVKKYRGEVILRAEIPLDDHRSIRMEAKDDLVGIFQLENKAMKGTIDAVGMESLNDVAAVTSLIRPGPKDMGMDMEYASRKNGAPFEIIPALVPVLGNTYGILVYQEQMMKISQVLCGFDGPMANKLRKACGKKLVDLMASIKEAFIKGAQPKIEAGEVTLEQVETLWDQIVSFARYGFNKSVDKDTQVITLDGVRRIEDIRPGQNVWCFDGTSFEQTEVVALHDHGMLPAFEVEFDDGSKEVCTINHKFLTARGQKPLGEILEHDLGVYADVEAKRRLALSDLRGIVSDEKDSRCSYGIGGSLSKGQAEDCEVCRMRGGVIEEAVREASPDVSGGNRSGKQEPVKAGSGKSCQGEGVECGGRSPRESGFAAQGFGCGREFAEGEGDEVEGNGCAEQNRLGTGEVVGDGQDNVIEARGSRGSVGASREVETGESGCVSGDNEKSSDGCEAVESGNMVGVFSRRDGIPEGSAGALRDSAEAMRFCKERLLDRGRRVLALRGDVLEEEISIPEGSREGPFIESRGGEAGVGSCSSRGGLLERVWEGSSERLMGGAVAGDSQEAEPGRVSIRKVLRVRAVGLRQMYDLEVHHGAHNFLLASGLITSNSHAVTYSMLSTAEMWLKNHYFVEYMTALLNNTKAGKKKHGSDNILVDYINYVRRRGTNVLPPDINLSGPGFTIESGGVRYGLGHVKNVASASENIVRIAAEKPFDDVADFYERCVYEQEIQSGVNAGKMRTSKPSKKVVESLVAAGAFDAFGTRQQVMAEYYKVRKEKVVPPELKDDEWELAETEVIGLCLSRPPIFTRFLTEMSTHGWRRLGDVSGRKKVTVLCRVDNIIPKTSRSGNPMLVVTVGDGMDKLSFFVFMAGKQQFLDAIRVGNIAAIPLDKFEDGDARFFDDRRGITVVEK